jgi:hypothetical protein
MKGCRNSRLNAARPAILLTVALVGIFSQLAAAQQRFDASLARKSPMTFHYASQGGNCDHCEWIAAQGTITADTPDSFKTFLGGDECYYLD